MKKFCPGTCAVLLALVFSFLPLTAVWGEPAPEVIRVGVSRMNDVFHGGGLKSGYLVDYLERIAYYGRTRAGRPLTFTLVPAADDRELERLLEAGEVDLVEVKRSGGRIYSVGGGYSGAFQKEIRLPERPFGSLLFSLCTLRGRTALNYEDPAGFDQILVGVEEGNSGIPLLEEYARENGFRYTLRVLPGKHELQEALINERVDAAVTDLGDGELSRTVARLGKTQYYLGTKDPELADMLDKLQDLLFTYQPYFDGILAEKYLAQRNDLYDAYTEDEKRFIEDLPPIRMAVCVKDRPNIYYDGKTYGGTYIDLLSLMEQHSGLKFTYVPAQSWDESLLLVREGKADAVLGIYGLESVAEKWDLRLSRPMLTKYIAVVGQTGRMPGADEIPTVGITGGRSEEWMAYLREYFPGWDERFYVSESRCFRAVSRGLVRFSLIDGNSVESNRLYARYKDVSTISSMTNSLDIVIGISKNAPEMLADVMDKSVESLRAAEVASCQMDNAMSYEMSPADFFLEYWPYLLMGGTVVAVAFAALAAVSLHRKRYAQQKSAFFSNMSHEIRTPLNGIIGMTAIAEKNLGNLERVRDCLGKIDTSCAHLLTIVNDILDLSKLENRKMEIAREPLDLSALLRPLHTLFFHQAAARGVDFDTVITGVEDEMFLGDAMRLSQILMNLLSNALKFTPEGKHIRLCVQQTARRGDTARIRFSVRDEGVGIPKENLSRIFSAYEQQGAKTAGKYGGSGLGLPISRQLAELMGGTLEVESAPGRGSEFYFSVDLPATAEKTPADSRLAGRRVLVYDPCGETRGYFKMLLESLGLSCSCAGSPAEALDQCGPVGYFLTDWAAPQARETLKAVLAGRDIMAIVYSAADYSEIRQETREAGAAWVLEKPVFRSALADALCRPFTDHTEREERKAAQPSFPGSHVLIAEDNEINMEILCELVSSAGCAIETAGDGQAAAEAFERSAPGWYDLIFMDIQMPKLNGYEAARRIRALDREDARSVPIIAMTADAFADDVARAGEAGMNRHLSKPVDVQKLYETMREFLGGNAV